MKNRLKLAILGAAVLAFSLFSGSSTLTAAGCGIPPIPPIPQIGCKKMQPTCVCDGSGQKCHWEFVCVK